MLRGLMSPCGLVLGELLLRCRTWGDGRFGGGVAGVDAVDGGGGGGFGDHFCWEILRLAGMGGWGHGGWGCVVVRKKVMEVVVYGREVWIG